MPISPCEKLPEVQPHVCCHQASVYQVLKIQCQVNDSPQV